MECWSRGSRLEFVGIGEIIGAQGRGNCSVSEETRNWFLNLADNERQIFLAQVSYDLTIHGRSFGLDLTGDVQVRAFKGLNELQHQISAHIAHLGEGTARYPEDVLWQILQEKAAAYGISNHLNSSIKRARSVCAF
jgi:hypothetical protein